MRWFPSQKLPCQDTGFLFAVHPWWLKQFSQRVQIGPTLVSALFPKHPNPFYMHIYVCICIIMFILYIISITYILHTYSIFKIYTIYVYIVCYFHWWYYWTVSYSLSWYLMLFRILLARQWPEVDLKKIRYFINNQYISDIDSIRLCCVYLKHIVLVPCQIAEPIIPLTSLYQVFMQYSTPEQQVLTWHRAFYSFFFPPQLQLQYTLFNLL